VRKYLSLSRGFAGLARVYTLKDLHRMNKELCFISWQNAPHNTYR